MNAAVRFSLLPVVGFLCTIPSQSALAGWQETFLSSEQHQELTDFAKLAGMARVWRPSLNMVGHPLELNGSLPSDAKADATARLDFPTPVMVIPGLTTKTKFEFEQYEVRRYGELLLAFPLMDGKAKEAPCAVGLDASGANSRQMDALYAAISRDDGPAKARDLARELVKVFPMDMDLWHRLSRLEEKMNDKAAATEASRKAMSSAQAVGLSIAKLKGTEGAKVRAAMSCLYWENALVVRYESLTGSPIPDLSATATPRNIQTSSIPQARESKSETLLPPYNEELSGHNEVRVRNPNDFAVAAGIRANTSGKNMEVPANGIRSVYLPDGKYDIYFVYSDRTNALFQGDSFTLRGNGVEIQIVKVANGNYGIRQVK